MVRAHDANLGRDVAVKFLYGGGASAGSVDRLLREGRALAALRHPAVLHVYEAVAVGTDLALVMEYVAGGDLARRLGDPGFGVEERLTVLDQIADGLAEAHRIGIVHRDLKPANILVGDTADRPRAKIADFGLARLARDAAAFRTQAGSTAYTPGFAPPEQIDDPDAESVEIDWYAFAATAHVLLLGALPGAISPPPAVSRIFERALDARPERRREPRVLMRQLHSVPREVWEQYVPATDAGKGPVEATGAAAATALPDSQSGEAPAPTPEPVPTAHTGPDPRAGLPIDVSATVPVPVYVPPRPRVPRAVLLVLWGVLLGTVLGLLVALLGLRG